MVISEIGEDLQLIALQLALEKLKVLNLVKYKLIMNFYYGNFKTVKAYADTENISKQAMSQKLHKALNLLRKLCFEELKHLEN